MSTRLCPGRPLPPYSYVPGRFPHPMSNPSGHSYGRHEPPCGPATDENWQACEAYLWGCDLFNHGYYWEAHESWEAMWHACGRKGSLADFLKGLIKLAAAGVKAREGSADGVRRHLLRGADLFDKVEQSHPGAMLLGLRPQLLAAVARDLAERGEDLVNPSSEPVVIVMPLEIHPVGCTA